MRAFQLDATSAEPGLVSVAGPDEPGPGQLLLRVVAAGLCRTDLTVIDLPPAARSRRFRLPLTLGHEGVGTVAAIGEGTTGVSVGESVAVYGPWGCGQCRVCASGRENYCPRAGRLGIRPPGLGAPGALAEYMMVDSVRHVIPIGHLDPAEAAALTDAGVSAYHSIERSLPKLGPDCTAVVIGAGGLGHLAIQLLRAVSPARIVAVDVAEEKLALAAEVGAHETVLAGPGAARQIRRLTDGYGAEAVLDFVASAETVSLAALCVAAGGDVTIVGTEGATIPVGFGSPGHSVAVAGSYWGSLPNLARVIELARIGLVRASVQRYGLEETTSAYEELREGRVRGRAVICPTG